MASTESGAVANLYRQWDVLTAEPGGVDYLETDADGTTVLWAVPHGCAADRVLLCVHGGGFVGGSVHTHRKMFAHLAKAAGTRALLVSYPLLPRGVHPGPVDQVAAAYRWLLGQGVEAGHIAFTGDSAGGGLAVTAQLRAREWGLPLPAATLLISAWVDMEVTGATMRSNSAAEALFTEQYVRELAQGFLGGTDPRDPLVSPLHADLTGFGPIRLQVGGAEVLLDDSRRLAAHAEKAGVEVLLDVYPEQQHTFQMMAGRAPEADDAITRLAEWVRPWLGL